MKPIRVEQFRKLGATIRKYRLKKGLTQAEVAQECNLKISTFRRLEDSISLPLSPENLIKIATAIDIEPVELLDLAQKYKENLIRFLHKYGPEVEALVDTLRVYSSDQASKIILYTLTGKEAEEILEGG